MILFSNSLHLLQHKKDEIKGFLYKMAKEVKFFSKGLYYKRYFVLNFHTQYLCIQDDIVSKKIVKIPFQRLLYIDAVQSHDPKVSKVSCPWKYSFALMTTDRKYFLFARTDEERFLWMSSFY